MQGYILSSIYKEILTIADSITVQRDQLQQNGKCETACVISVVIKEVEWEETMAISLE
jgi:hypothetical protein